MCWVGVRCQIYRTPYNISNISYLSLPPLSFSFILHSPIPGIVSAGLTFPFTCMCTQYSSSYTFSPLPLPIGTNPPTGDLLHPPVLQFCDISMYLCIKTRIGSSLPFFSFLSSFPSYGGFNMYKNSGFILV
jgi:hypothetical protein